MLTVCEWVREDEPTGEPSDNLDSWVSEALTETDSDIRYVCAGDLTAFIGTVLPVLPWSYCPRWFVWNNLKC